MIVKGLAHTALNVSDMEKSVAFYCNVLGFKKAFEMSEPNTGEPWIVYLHAGGNQFIELFYGGVNFTEYDNANIGFSHLCFEVSDIQAIAKQITDAGAELDRPVKFGIDNNWQCWVRDPDRNRIELMQVGEDSPQVKFLNELR
ncbi:MAG: VOC family protein [Hespellia sp.]|nr:VOC family protein [Hespellia sp.]